MRVHTHTHTLDDLSVLEDRDRQKCWETQVHFDNIHPFTVACVMLCFFKQFSRHKGFKLSVTV